MSDLPTPPILDPAAARLQQVAHALGAPLCALEVVLGAKGQLPPEPRALLEEAIDRLRQILADLQALR